MIYRDLPRPCKSCVNCNVIPSCETKYSLYKDYVCYYGNIEQIQKTGKCLEYFSKNWMVNKNE